MRSSTAAVVAVVIAVAATVAVLAFQDQSGSPTTPKRVASTTARSVTAGPVLYVAPTGRDAAAGTRDAPLLSIGGAMKRLSESGGSVVLAAGTYPELIFRQPATKRIYVTGETPVVRRPNRLHQPTSSIAGARLGGATNVTLTGLELTKDIQVAGKPKAMARGLRFERLELDGKGVGSGIRMRSGIADLELRQSWIHDCLRGVSGSNPPSQPPVEGITISGNLIERCSADGIAFGGWKDTMIDRNTIRDFAATDTTVHNDGIQVFGYTSHLTITRNRISDSNGQLVLLQSQTGQTSDVTLANNVLFGGEGFAVQASGMPGFKLINNTIWNTGGFSAVLLRSPPPQHPEYDFRDAVVANNILSGLALYGVALRSRSLRGNFSLPGARAVRAPGNRVGRDPGFVDARRGDFRLRARAVARRGGVGTLTPPTDVTGRKRANPLGIGAYR